MADMRAKVMVMTNDGRKVHAIIPTNVTAGRLLPNLLQSLDLPTEGAGGQPMTYYLTMERQDEGPTQVDADNVLHDIGVAEGTVLRVVPSMRAGARKVAS